MAPLNSLLRTSVMALCLAHPLLAAPATRHIYARADPVAMDVDFPDPSILRDSDGTWYAFATQGNGHQVQAATAPSAQGPWTFLPDVDLLPNSGPFFTGRQTWAPDIRQIDDGSYVMYFSGEVASNTAHHCLGIATSKTILGPYAPRDEPFECDLSVGGAIDASGFRDNDGTRWVTYKIDGNSIGKGGSCNNGVEPRVRTPIMLQKLAGNGVDKVGGPTMILNNDVSGGEHDDGPYVEAPDIYFDKGTSQYVLFFNSGCYTDPSYATHFALSQSVTGPYVRPAGTKDLLISSGDKLGLVAPGGATAARDGSGIVFHSDCSKGRCMHAKGFVVDGEEITIV